jgi:hypothetical protein
LKNHFDGIKKMLKEKYKTADGATLAFQTAKQA